jgi:branched-chain amino acid transport system permease protein
MAEFLQLVFSGLTVGAVYSLVALGFTLVYNASDVINFAQGEFVMIGGMSTVVLAAIGVPFPLAALIAVLSAIVIGLLLHRLAIEPAKDAPPVTMIMITIGASLFLRGVAQILFDKEFHSLQPFSGSIPIMIGGATILPQSLWVIGGSLTLVASLSLFLRRTLVGKAMLATSSNRLAARLVGIDVTAILALAFGVSAAIGAIAGILAAPITLTRYDIGTIFALKGFAAAMVGGMGNPLGAIVGGFLIGLIEAFGAGYVSSTYKEAMAFLAILLVLFAMPRGLLGGRILERV